MLLLAISALLHDFQVAAPPSPAAIMVIVPAILISAWVVMGATFARALSLASGPGAISGRMLAHLAFAAPSVLVGFGDVAGLLHACGAVVLPGHRSGSPGVAT